jgi:feruloyl esterase
MQEAQRFPDDYDGIVNGDAARDLTHEWAGELYPAWIARSDQQGLVAKMPALHAAVLAKCDKIDGLEDGLIEEPAKCDFDPATIQCAPGVDNESCLTPTQVEWVRKIYRGIVDRATGNVFWPGPALGSELQWHDHIHPDTLVLPLNYMRSFVYLDPNWMYTDPSFSFDTVEGLKALNDASAKFGPVLDADNPDLRAFEKHGGKIIFYHGLSDNAISSASMIAYYKRVVATVGASQNSAAALKKAEGFARLFTVPGMAHCGGGEGPNQFDALGALDEWVEHGNAPDQIIASRVIDGKTMRTRPLCPYPQVAKYKGSGSIDEAQNFVCAAP